MSARGKNLGSKIKVFIVEDHPVYSLGLKELINQEDDMEVCGSAVDTETAWHQIKKAGPDIVITDLILKKSSGIDLIRNIKKLHDELPVLVISMLDEMQYAERAFAAGASGYIMKHEASGSIVDAIRAVSSGKRYMSEEITSAFVDRAINHGTFHKLSGIDSLTDRELEIFRLIGNGLATGEIASQLRINVKTVGTYRERIKQKLGIKSSACLVREAMRWLSDFSGNSKV